MNSKSTFEMDESDISRAGDTLKSYKSGTMSSNLSRNEDPKPIERRTRSARKSISGPI